MVASSIYDVSHKKKAEAHPHLVIRLINVKCERAQQRFCTARFVPSAFLPENNSDHAHGAGFFQPHHNNAMLSNNNKKIHLQDLCTSLLQHVTTVAEAKANLQVDNKSLKVLIL